MVIGLRFVTLIEGLLLEFILTELISVELKFYFYFDWVRCVFLSVVLFISSIVVFYRERYMEGDFGKLKFLYVVLLFVLSIVLMIISPNIVIILLGWDGLGLVSYCLVIFYQNERSSSAGIITVLSNRIGDVGILLAIIFIINFGNWGILEFSRSAGIIYYVGGFIILGAITKRAQMPFSAWLPAAIAAPTPVSSLVHSSTLVTAGVYLIIRIREFYLRGELSYILMYVSILTIFISGLGANLETDLKKIIALSTLSQLGVIIMILSVGYYNLAFFHLITHALFKAILFLCAGVIIHGVGGAQDIRIMGLIWRVSPLVRGLTTLARLSLAGFPYLRGFYRKDLILEFMYIINNNFILLLFVIFATIFTVTYSLRLIYYGLWKGLIESPVQGYRESIVIVGPIILIGIFVIFAGCFLSWVLFPHPFFVNLRLQVKIINLGLVFLGGWVFFMLFNCVWKREELGRYSWFFGSMWFLPYITRGCIMRGLRSSLFYYTKRDQGWIEELGAVGLRKIIKERSIFLVGLQYGSLKRFIIMMGLGVIYLVYYFYSLNKT